MNKNTNGLATSEKIIKSAYHLLSEKGYANITMRNIAQEANVALSQLTYHYESKEGLILAVMESAMNKFFLICEARVFANTSIKIDFDSIAEAFNYMRSEYGDFLRVFADFSVQALWAPSFAQLIKSFFQKLLDRLTVFIEEDEKLAGQIEKFGVRELAKCYIGAFIGVGVEKTVLDWDEASTKAASMQRNAFFHEEILGKIAPKGDKK